MSKLKALKEQRGDLLAKAQAILDVAGDREPSDKDRADYDAIMDEKTGQIAVLDGDISRWEKIEARQKELAVQQLANSPFAGGGSPANYGGRSGVRVQYVPQRHQKLQAFESVDDAFISGIQVAAMCGNAKAKQWMADNSTAFAGVQNAMQSSGNTDGGFLIIPQFETAILRLIPNYGVIRRDAYHYPMTSDQVYLPRQEDNMVAYWTADVPATATTETSTKITRKEMVAKALQARCLISKFMEADSFASVGELVARDAARAFAKAEDQAGFIGDASATYGGHTGLKNAIGSAGVVTAGSTEVSFGTLKIDTFLNMIALLPTYTTPSKVKWYMSRPARVLSAGRLQQAAGGNTVMDVAGRIVPQLLGYPIEDVDVMNATTGSQASATGVCFLGDLDQELTFGERMGMTLQVLLEKYAESNQNGLLFTQRCGMVHRDPGDSTNPGSIISLTLAGS